MTPGGCSRRRGPGLEGGDGRRAHRAPGARLSGVRPAVAAPWRKAWSIRFSSAVFLSLSRLRAVLPVSGTPRAGVRQGGEGATRDPELAGRDWAPGPQAWSVPPTVAWRPAFRPVEDNWAGRGPPATVLCTHRRLSLMVPAVPCSPQLGLSSHLPGPQ